MQSVTRALTCLALVSLAECRESPPSAAAPEMPKLEASANEPLRDAAAIVAPPFGAAPKASVAPSAAAALSTALATVDPAHVPPLFDEAGKLLPQTDIEPRTDSPTFQKNLALLWNAIATGDSSIAEPTFFPAPAYEVIKDIEKARADWKHRLLRAFQRDVRVYHKELGKNPEACRFVRLELVRRPKWVKPGDEGNRIGYWRTTRAKLVFSDADGKDRSLEITSFISWRGEWYVVHLHGFQ